MMGGFLYRQMLRDQILRGSDFKRKKLKNFDPVRFTINVPITLYRLSDGRRFECTGSYAVENESTLRFVTLIPEVYHE